MRRIAYSVPIYLAGLIDYFDLIALYSWQRLLYHEIKFLINILYEILLNFSQLVENHLLHHLL